MNLQKYALVVCILLGGCSPQLDDLKAYTAQVKASAVVHIEPYPEFKSHPSFSYDAHSLRSPFIRPKDKTAPTLKVPQRRCLQPDFSRSKQPLEAYGIDALSFSGQFSANGVDWALIQSNDGVLHKAQRGSRIGLFYGTLKHINKTTLIIEQLLPDGAGCWQKKEATLTLASMAGEQ